MYCSTCKRVRPMSPAQGRKTCRECLVKRRQKRRSEKEKNGRLSRMIREQETELGAQKCNSCKCLKSGDTDFLLRRKTCIKCLKKRSVKRQAYKCPYLATLTRSEQLCPLSKVDLSRCDYYDVPEDVKRQYSNIYMSQNYPKEVVSGGMSFTSCLFT